MKMMNHRFCRIYIHLIGHVHHSPGDNFVGSDEPASYKTSIEVNNIINDKSTN